MAIKKTKSTFTYTYEYQNGQISELEVGKDGVTQELIDFLNASDREISLQERYKNEHEDPVFQCFLRYYGKTSKAMDNPIDQIPDDASDIMSILFPEDDSISCMLMEMPKILEMLTESQRDLIWEAYGLQKGDTEIAQEQNVTRIAIHNRRTKIMKRVEKLLKEAVSQKP